MLGVDDPTLVKMVGDLGEAEQRRLSMLQTITETNPLVTALDDQINALKNGINSSIKNFKQGLEITKNQLRQRNSQFESSISRVPSQERGLLDVMRQQHLQDTLYMYLLQKREEVGMKLASGVPDSRTIDKVRSSRVPVKPIKSIIYLLFFIVGFVIPIAIIYVRDLLNFRISRRYDIEKITPTPIIAEVSQSNDPGSLLVSSKPRSMVAEQIRALRTNLQFVIPKENQKVILFTSSMSGEGKSFISLNLGASVAMSGKKVVILELDLRKPKLHSGLAISNTNGLSNYLIGQAGIGEILKPVEQQKNYYIITSGPIPPNPAELLVNGQIEILIEELKKQFDYIVLDAPPVGLVTDAQILGRFADVTFFIVRHGYTAKNQIYAIDNLYRTRKFNNLNIIINSVELARTYGYGYGYGGYYSEDDDETSGTLTGLLKKKK
jgi:capsular exopolysaccharide synthesis family protein